MTAYSAVGFLSQDAATPTAFSSMIDFADIDFSDVQQPSFSGDASGGMLTVTDGAHAANIALLGNYLASTFVASSDGHGGTSVVDPPAASAIQNALLGPPQHA